MLTPAALSLAFARAIADNDDSEQEMSLSSHSVERVVLAQPRGFCAGVDRAVEIIELAVESFDPPVYCRKEIVHNRHVVDSFEKKGVIFVDELSEVPPGATVVFSARVILSL